MSLSKTGSRPLSQPAVAALAIGLLGWVGFSSPAEAETATLQELIEGRTLTVGNFEFFNFVVVDVEANGLNESVITVETIDDTDFPGFTTFGNGELAGDAVVLEYEFEVRTLNLQPLIYGGVLELNEFSAVVDSEIDIETDEGGFLNLAVFVVNEEAQLLDAGVLQAPTPRTLFEGRVSLDQNSPGTHEVESYSTRILEVSSEDCGNNMLEQGEQCDPPDLITCDENCLDIVCGNEIHQPGEGCDPPDGVTCNDSCEQIVNGCGNDLQQPGEECDGTDDGACPGECLGDCSCSGDPGPYCGDGVADAPDEECDGADAGACAAGCLPNCACRTVVLCPFQVDPTCIASDKASLKVDEKKEGKEKLNVSLQKLAAATTLADFGDPVTGTTLYEVCVYGEDDRLVAPLRVDRAQDVCGSKDKDCWKAEKKGPKYKDEDAASAGVKKIQTKSGDAGKGQVKADAANNAKKGQTSLPTGVTDRLLGATRATVQVQTDDAACFGATLDEVKKNDVEKFEAKFKN